MLKSGVTSTSTGFEPGAAATTTTALPRFRDGAAFWTCETDDRRRGCWCFHAGIDQTQKQQQKITFTDESWRIIHKP